MTNVGIRIGALLALAAAFASCDGPPVEDSSLAVANELRALRQQLQAQQQTQQTANAATPGIDGKAFTEALAPLREAMQTVLREQQSQQQRQLALTEELGRWVAASAAAGSQENQQQVAALRARLQELETTLRAQDARHREVETAVQKALDATTSRLESFLQLLDRSRGKTATEPPSKSGDAGNGSTPANGNAPATEPKKADAGKPDSGKPDAGKTEAGKTETGQNTEPKRSAGLVGQTGLGRQQKGWLLTVLIGGLAAIGALAWRLLRSGSAAARAAAPIEPVVDAGTEELWAAASLLGDAVGSLRKVAAIAPEVAASASAPPLLAEMFAQLSGALPEEVAASAGPSAVAPTVSAPSTPAASSTTSLDIGSAASAASEPRFTAAPFRADEPAPAPIAARPPATPVPAPNAPATPRLAPPRVQLQIARGDAASAELVIARLSRDPRVLRQPAPAVAATAHGLLIEFTLVPGLPAGEVEHVRASLRMAAQPHG